MQPHAPAEVQHLKPKHWFEQLDALQLPPLDEPDELPEREPEALPELEPCVQLPRVQTFPVAVQSTQLAPAAPQVVSSPIVWHAPFASQHPLMQVRAQFAAASSDDEGLASSPVLPVPLLSLPLLVLAPLPLLPLLVLAPLLLLPLLALVPLPLLPPLLLPALGLPLPLRAGWPDDASGPNG